MAAQKQGAVGALERIGPTRAREILTQNRSNRPLNRPRVRRYAEAMRRGLWRLNGETIKISRTGRLLDGQHRLEAIIESGCTIDLFVVYELDDEVFSTIDTGARRSAADTLAVMGVKYAKTVAAALKIIDGYLERLISVHSFPDLTNDRVKELWAAHRAVLSSVSFGESKEMRKVVLVRAVPVALHYLFAQVNADEAGGFMEDLAQGAMLAEHDPVLRLRNQLLSDRASKSRMGRGYMVALFIRAWNARREGRGIRYLRLRSGDPFPEIDGLPPRNPRAGELRS